MNNSFSAEQLELFETTYGKALASAVATTDPSQLTARVPAEWLDLVDSPRASAIKAIWEPAIGELPRFVDYLSSSIDGAAIIDVHGFPALVMSLPDWNEENCELGPGFCWMGVPAEAARVDALVTEVGAIPASLTQLWKVANFINIKEHSLLCSVEPSTRSMTEAPIILPPLPDVEEPEGAYECLQIAVVNNQMVTCMTRPPGQECWNDNLVRRFRRTGQISRSIRTHLDDSLADWTFHEWIR